METNINIVKEVSDSYLEYSLASITRSIPDYRDGLIPVYRRIIWGAKDGFSSANKHKKSAKLSGEVMGNFHPHSDNYGSIVSLTTHYNSNYPLIDGQGSFGDSCSPAASSRYTEVRLQTFTEEVLLQEKESLELKLNYDGTQKEPIYLNVRLPILLLRGSNSISVGFATCIPQYNLHEISKYLLGDKTVTTLYPDFPTGCQIFIDPEKPTSIIQKAVISKEEIELLGKRKKKEYISIEFSNLPYNSNPEKIGAQIKAIVQTEKLLPNDITSVSDLSDRTGDCIQVVIAADRKAEILNTLYKYTDLQSTFSVNFTVLVDGIPKTLDPLSYLDLWKKWRLERIVKYNQVKLESLEKDSLLLREILIVLKNKSKCIEILDSNSNYKDSLKAICDFYKISKESAEYFLNLPIKKLANLEVSKYELELKDVLSQISICQKNISNPLKKFKEEITKYTNEYKLERKSKIITVQAQSNSEINKVEKNSALSTPIKRTFSLDRNKGFIKKGSEYCEPILIVCSDGNLYRISTTQKFGPIGNKSFKVLFAIKESEKNNSNDVLLLEDKTNSLAKRVKISDLSATSKGFKLGFDTLTNVSIKNNSPIKIKGKGAQPTKV